MNWPKKLRTNVYTKMKSKTVGIQPQQPTIDHRTGDVSGDGSTEQPEESPLSAPLAAAASTAPATVETGDESGSASEGSQAREGDEKPAFPSVDLTDEQHEVVKRFRKMQSQPDCSELNLGSALLDIKRNQRLPMRGGNIENCEQLLGLDRFEVRRLVGLAEPHRAEHGGGSPARSADLRPSGSSASRQPPASPPEAATGDERSAAPISAPEKKRATTKIPKAAEAVAPQPGEPVQDLALPPVETAIPDSAEPARASVEPVEPAAAVFPASVPDTNPAVAEAVVRLHCLRPMLPAELSVDDWASRINDAVGEGIKRFIIAGSELRAAKEALDHGCWMKMFESRRIKMSLRTAEMFMRVAANAALSNSQHLANLPPSLTALDALAGGPVEVIETGIKNGKIHPDLTAKQAQNFVRAHCPRPVVKSAGKQCDSGTLCPPSGTETADLPKSPTAKSPTESVIAGVADMSDSPSPSLTPTEAAPSQPERSPDAAPAPFGADEFDVDAEWQIIERTLHGLFRRCPTCRRGRLWRKLNAFCCNFDLAPTDQG